MKLGALFVLIFFASTTQAKVNEHCRSIQRASVSSVYPSAQYLPENLLRFYIYFTKPMQKLNDLSFVYLSDEGGQRLPGVFLENKFNLWSPDGMRLTLLFDPGRVKTGLVAHNTFGRALKPGKTYQLMLTSELRDMMGCSVKTKMIKEFAVTPPDLETPNPTKWQMNQPNEGSSESLRLMLNDTLDHLSMAYRLRVVNQEGHSIEGNIYVDNNEQVWLFTPRHKWSNTQYRLAVDPLIEDIAGNRASGLFDQPSLIEESEALQKKYYLPIHLSPTSNLKQRTQ